MGAAMVILVTAVGSYLPLVKLSGCNDVTHVFYDRGFVFAALLTDGSIDDDDDMDGMMIPAYQPNA